MHRMAIYATGPESGSCGHANFHHGRHAISGHRAHERHGGGWGGPPFGGGGGRGRGRRARRGDMRTATLLLLAEEPRNGYQLMQEIEQRSGGAWSPSAGSVYPALQLLEDEGLIRSEEVEGRKLLHLTDAGRALVEERGKDQPAPWEQMAGDVPDDARAMMKVVKEVMIATSQVMQNGSDSQRAEAHRLLVTLRRDIYRILAEGDEGDEGEDA
ncbi:MAG TPA: PadR family transcriptional regulator [Conexibacter sp.]|nr:PadR family transcriptional regulator [Conexibacter sp.]